MTYSSKSTRAGRRSVAARAAILAVCGALAGAGSAAAQGTVTGTVTAAETGAAVAGAQVSIPSLSLGAITGPTGSYTIGDVPTGSHEVVVVLIGFQTERRQVTVAEGGAAQASFSLTTVAVELEGLVAVGSRARPRTVTESPVPVDVIPTREIVRQGDTDFANLLRNVVPSFNVNTQPISDAATFARPANLRGLAPDHTLVLVNGKRRHRTAVITWYGNGLADGSQGPDLALIPGAALEQAEVLRDGAAAQYGSDAIAGVMNFVLRNDRSGGFDRAQDRRPPPGRHEQPGGPGRPSRRRRHVHAHRQLRASPGRDRLPEPDRRVRQRAADGSQRAAQRRGRAHQLRQQQRAGPGPDLGIARSVRRAQAVGQHRLRLRRPEPVLRSRQLREQDGRGRVLLP